MNLQEASTAVFIQAVSRCNTQLVRELITCGFVPKLYVYNNYNNLIALIGVERYDRRRASNTRKILIGVYHDLKPSMETIQ